MMARKEAKLRQSLGLPVGLIERNGQPAQRVIAQRVIAQRMMPQEMMDRNGLSGSARGKSAGGGARATPVKPATQARIR